MKTFKNSAAQGDLLIRRIDELPTNVEKVESGDAHIVAHSETGHHHTINAAQADLYSAANDGMVMFLVVDDHADLIHNRSYDTHDTVRIPKGIYEIRRQREYTPEGWRRVAD